MSQLNDWILTTLHRHGECRLGDLEQAFRADVCVTRKMRQDHPTGVIVRELIALGYSIEPRGRKDQPARWVVGLSFEPMPMPMITVSGPQIVAWLHENTITRYAFRTRDDPAFDDGDHWILTVFQRPDYSPDTYRIPYGEAAERLTAAGIACEAGQVKAALEAKSRDSEAHASKFNKPFFEDMEYACCLRAQYVHTVAPSGLVGVRWPVAGEQPYWEPCDDNNAAHVHNYHGPCIPAAAQAELSTGITDSESDCPDSFHTRRTYPLR
jgi:hypothetical protein